MDNKFLELAFISNESSLNLGKQAEYKIVELEGIESADYELVLGDNINYDGSVLKDKRIGKRAISLRGEYTGSNSNDIERRRLIKFFNPKNSGTLKLNYSGNKYVIDYEIESFKTSTTNIHEPLEFIVDVVCPNPYFSSYEDEVNEICSLKGGVKFKFTLPFKLKEKDENRKVLINNGDVDTPIKVVFKGPALNPLIRNIDTNEFIRVKRQLTSDEVLYINTAYGNKTVNIKRVGKNQLENAFNYIDLDSTFFQLKPGENMIEYNSEDKEESIQSQIVEISYKNRYLGI